MRAIAYIFMSSTVLDSGMSPLPIACLIAISQIVATLIQIDASGERIKSRASFDKRRLSAIAHSATSATISTAMAEM